MSTDNFIPTGLLKAWLNRWNHAPAGSITYSTDQIVFREEPWIVEVEFASLLLGASPKHLARYKGVLERALSSPYCRIIRCWAEVGRKSLIEDLDTSGFEHKIRLVPYGVAPKKFTKEYDQNEKTKLLFVGSGTSRGGFDYRGGREAIEMFAQLRKQYPNLEMVVRSDIPRDVRARYHNLEGLRIIDSFISEERLAAEFQTADIFLIPSHNTSPMITLDALSYELPVLTIDTWANPECVEDGKTGFVVPRTKRLEYFHGDTHQPNWLAPEFVQGMQHPDPEVVYNLCKRAALLIENPELRRTMGKAARWEVEHGRFSLATVNQQLGRVFDEAIAPDD